MFPTLRTLTTAKAMSPDLVDQTILGLCKPQFLKVARVIADVATTLNIPMLRVERLFFDETLEKPTGTEVDFIADRIKALVEAERLESAGNLDQWRFSEIRLTGK
jgi:hypothetical protein